MPPQSSPTNQGKALCLLSLDAGGLRGISQLKILVELMHRLGQEANEDVIRYPYAIFDMIGGAGSGGFIAILLVVFRLTAEETLEEFIALTTHVLEKPGLNASTRTGVLKKYVDSLLEKYEVRKEARLLDMGSQPQRCKLVVPISYKHHIGSMCTLRNFSVRKEQAVNLTIYEALLATLVTPPLFTSISIFKDSALFEYIGADLSFSNPAREIITEAYGTFGSEQSIACLLSLGCGHPGIIASPDDPDMANWMRLLERLVMDSEQKAQSIDSQMGHLGLYHRFCVATGLERELSIASPTTNDIIAHTLVYIADVIVSRKMDHCVDLLTVRDGAASLEQLKHSGGQNVLPPALPSPTRTFVIRQGPWDFIEKTIFGDAPSKESDQPRMLVVTGMGGCGKTQLILKFMRVHEADFASLFFIDGSSKPRIRADITRHVRSLGAEHSQMGFDDCLAFLSQPSPNGPRLILYDNVDDPDLELPPLLPRGGSCAVVVTTRNRLLGELAPDSHLELDVMSVEESMELLLFNSKDLGSITSGAGEEARAIAEALGCLPIALTQARSYMYQTKCTARAYLERLVNGKSKILAHPIKNHPDMRYTSTYAAFDASFEMLAVQVQRLLRLLSFFHWGDFPLELIVLAAKFGFSRYDQQYLDPGSEFYIGKGLLEDIFLRDGEWDVTNLDDMMIALQSYSLVTLAPGVDTLLVQIHPVAHDWVRSCTPEDEQNRYQAAATLLLALGAREEHTPSSQYLSSHATHMGPLWDQLHVNDTGAFGHILREGGLLPGALQMREKVASIIRERKDAGDVILADALYALSTAYYDLGRLKEAEDVQLEVLKLREETQGERHPKTIITSSDLSRTYVRVGRLKEAEVLQAQVLRLRKETQGTRHPDTIAASSILAVTYRDLGRYEEARELEEEVLMLRTEILGPRHPETIMASNNLGCTYHSMGRFEESERVLGEVLVMLKEVVGERHPDTLNAYGNLANAYRELGRLEDAETLQLEALRLRRDILGDRHPDTARAMLDLAEIGVTLGKGSSVLDMINNAGSIISETLGENNRWYMQYLNLQRRVEALKEGPNLILPDKIKDGMIGGATSKVLELSQGPEPKSNLIITVLVSLTVSVLLAFIMYYRM